MSQILWMISVIPDYLIIGFINSIIFIGVISLFACQFMGYIPYINYYKPIIYTIGLVLLLFGLYFKGMYNADSNWKQRVAEMKEQVKQAEEKSKEKNVEIQTKIVTKIQYIKDNQYKTSQLIKSIAPTIDSECILDPQIVFILNSSAKQSLQ